MIAAGGTTRSPFRLNQVKATNLRGGEKMRLNRDTALFLRKSLIYFTAAFVSAIVQTSFLAVLRPLGVVPDLVLLLALGVGYFCGAEKGGIIGALSGVVAYALGDVGLAFLPLLYALVGVAAGLLVESFFAGKFTVWCLYVFCAAAIKGAYSLACCIILSGDVRIFGVLFYTVIPELVATLILGAAIYYPMKKLGEVL